MTRLTSALIALSLLAAPAAHAGQGGTGFFRELAARHRSEPQALPRGRDDGRFDLRAPGSDARACLRREVARGKVRMYHDRACLARLEKRERHRNAQTCTVQRWTPKGWRDMPSAECGRGARR